MVHHILEMPAGVRPLEYRVSRPFEHPKLCAGYRFLVRAHLDVVSRMPYTFLHLAFPFSGPVVMPSSLHITASKAFVCLSD